jgi:spore coat polysaccharide biosynthesis protein SpsF
MKTVAIIQARYTSTRLPGKVLMKLAGKPVLTHIIDRLRSISEVDEICLSIPDGQAQQPLLDFAQNIESLTVSRGPDEDLVRRFTNAVNDTKADIFIRAWADCPAINPTAVLALISSFRSEDVAYAEIPYDSGYPEGYEAQVFSADIIRTIDKEATTPSDRELVTPYMTRKQERFPCLRLHRAPSNNNIKLLLDTANDYEKLKQIFATLYPISPLFGLTEIEEYAKNHDVG